MDLLAVCESPSRIELTKFLRGGRGVEADRARPGFDRVFARAVEQCASQPGGTLTVAVATTVPSNSTTELFR